MKAKDLEGKMGPPTIVLVGRPGCGKTALMAQIGAGGYIFDFDAGMRTALTLQDSFTKFRHSVDFDIYKDENPMQPKQFTAAIQKLTQLRSAEKKPRAIGVDSLTSLAEHIKTFVMSTSKSKSGRTFEAFATPEIQHYGTMVRKLDMFLVSLASLNVPLILCAHDAFVETEEAGVLHYINSVTKNHGRNGLIWRFDEVLHMKARPVGAGEKQYVVDAQGEGLPVRTRSGLFKPLDVGKAGLQGLLKQIGYDYEPRSDS